MQQIYFTILLRKAIHLIVMELIAAHPRHGPEKSLQPVLYTAGSQIAVRGC